MREHNERGNSNSSNRYPSYDQRISYDNNGQNQTQSNVMSRSLWQNHPQIQHQSNQRQQIMNKQTTGTVHGKTPMLMANNDVFTTGPYRTRKDRQRISVLKKYEIIGYIAAGTYGKVYKAKRQVQNNDVTQEKTGPIVNENSIRSPNSNIPTNNHNINTDSRSSKNNMENQADKARNDQDTRSRTNSNNTEHGKDDINKRNSRTNSHENMTNSNSGTENLNSRDLSVDFSNMHSPTKKKQLPSYFAIKKFKTEKEGVEQLHYTGISQSACREMALCRELSNKHLTKLVEIFLERKSIYMVYEYAEHDLLQIIHYHSHPEKRMIPARMVRSIMWQILDGVSYLHQNWILHRDLKPANIMVTVDGCVKIGDLGLARKFSNMLQTLYTGDKVVVTIWYRAPELLLGARHYTPSIDIWAVGCIFAELIGLQPIFKGEEAKMDSKKTVPFQANQLQRILELLGTPSSKSWSNLHKYPEYEQFLKFPKFRNNLPAWYHSTGGRDRNALELISKVLEYDPIKRIDALDSLDHNYFTNGDYPVCENVFEGLNYKYPARRIHTNDNDIMNLGVHRNKNLNIQQQTVVNNSAANTLGGLGVNRRILAAAAAAAAAVTGNNSQGNSRSSEPSRKKRR